MNWISRLNSSLITSNICWSRSPPTQLLARLTIIKFFIMKFNLCSVIFHQLVPTLQDGDFTESVQSLISNHKALDWCERSTTVCKQGTGHCTGHEAGETLSTSNLLLISCLLSSNFYKNSRDSIWLIFDLSSRFWHHQPLLQEDHASAV